MLLPRAPTHDVSDLGLSRDLLHRLPKAELHVHLDGCLRPATMLALAQAHGVRLPATDAGSLARAMFVAGAQSLEEYLEKYTVTLAVMQTADALERIAYEFVLDAAAENVRYVEVRFCPALHTPALTYARAVEAPLAGLRRGEGETGTMARLIVCALRTLPPAVSLDLARLAVDYRRDGVVGFDLAGAERGHPARDHAAAFAHARGHGLACTCHAGEGDGPESIRQALEICGAQRIGHGTRLGEDPDLEALVADQGITLEMCLTSNLHTHAVSTLARHPARSYMARGCAVTLNTDSRLMDATTLTDEYLAAHRELRLTRPELDRMLVNAARGAFLPAPERADLVHRMTTELVEVM
ncbi:MAG TPA: adenosine deaminase [Gemmatimonadales bacterium]|nr:adenosine deaminase [Gemmatimonadales bacterium]